MPETFHLEDFHAGQRFVTGTALMDEASIVAFAKQFDPQPFHTDPEAARHSFFGGLAASGWHTAAVSMRLIIDGTPPIAGGQIGASVELSWPRPTRPGDVLHVECEVLAVTPSRSKPDRGFITMKSLTKNQRGEVVQVQTSKILVRKRGSSGEAVGR
jgi:acyl dehydratase